MGICRSVLVARRQSSDQAEGASPPSLPGPGSEGFNDAHENLISPNLLPGLSQRGPDPAPAGARLLPRCGVELGELAGISASQ